MTLSHLKVIFNPFLGTFNKSISRICLFHTQVSVYQKHHKLSKWERPPMSLEDYFRQQWYEVLPRERRYVKQNAGRRKYRQTRQTEIRHNGYIVVQQNSANKRFKNDDVFFITDQHSPRYSIEDIVSALKAYDLFGGEEIRLALKLNMNQEKMHISPFKGLIHFPKSLTPLQTVLVFAEGELAEEARQAGATIVGGEELIPLVEKEELEFDHALCSLDFLPKIRHLPRILKQKMPNTRRGSATNDLASTLPNYLSSEAYETNRFGSLQKVLGDTSFSESEISTNLKIMLRTVATHKHPSMKNNDIFFQSISLQLPSGPGFHIKLEDVM